MTPLQQILKRINDVRGLYFLGVLAVVAMINYWYSTPEMVSPLIFLMDITVFVALTWFYAKVLRETEPRPVISVSVDHMEVAERTDTE